MKQKTVWRIVSAGCALGLAAVARKALDQSWKITAGGDPPKNPAAVDVRWGEALMWTTASAMVAGLARLVAKRGAAAGWAWLFEEKPPI